MSTPMESIPIADLVEKIKNPDATIQQKIRQLRTAYTVDKKLYDNLKKTLPYFVCAKFSPAFRKKENFAFTDYFILDIDHISQKSYSIAELRDRIQKDNRVFISFVSPSEDGLKVLFRLQDRCLDANVYSVFYKKFVFEFSQQHKLEQVIDAVTSDVSRACFVSFDPNVYYNQDADFVNMNDYVSEDNVGKFFTEEKEVENKIKKENQGLIELLNEVDDGNNSADTEPDSQTIDEIKKKLKIVIKKKPVVTVFVPEQLDEIAEELKTKVEETGVVVETIKNIYYGKQIMFKIGQKKAEVNVFYSPKRNECSVVASTRTGTDLELNEMMKESIESLLAQMKYGY